MLLSQSALSLVKYAKFNALLVNLVLNILYMTDHKGVDVQVCMPKSAAVSLYIVQMVQCWRDDRLCPNKWAKASGDKPTSFAKGNVNLFRMW